MAYSRNKDTNSVKMKMTMDTNAGVSQSPQVSVFVAIDTSGSMAGAKINQVCSSLNEIITKAPNYVRFIIRKFDNDVVTVVSKKKKYLDVSRLNSSLKRCGNMTALYDAWGQVIKEIPYGVAKLDAAHVLIFTDGEDNRSTKFDLNSVIALVNERIGKSVQLTFIQAGPHTKVATELESKCSKEYCSVIKVEDSVEGINYGFQKAKQRITFEISLEDAAFVAQLGGLTITNKNFNRRPDTRSITVNCSSGTGNGLLPIPRSLVGPSFPTSSGSMVQPSIAFGQPNVPFCKQSVPASKATNENKSKGSFKPKPTRTTDSGEPTAPASSVSVPKPTRATANNYEHSISIGDIPSSVTAKFPSKSLSQILLEFFKIWGKCKVTKVDVNNSIITAVISYSTLAEKRHALLFGNHTDFHGTRLSVRE